jgi:predicted RNA binding protein YcfA (HicA-like mRNA interferase family)
MPKLPSISPQELAKALEKDGFALIRIRGSHHTYYNDEKELVTVVPFHGYDIPKRLLCKILKEADISRDELQDLL